MKVTFYQLLTFAFLCGVPWWVPEISDGHHKDITHSSDSLIFIKQCTDSVRKEKHLLHEKFQTQLKADLEVLQEAQTKLVQYKSLSQKFQ